MPLGEHVYCVAASFKMTEQVEQWICIKFGLKLEHSSAKIILMIQKAAAMGNWWLAASSRQCACSYIMSCAKFFCKTSNHPGYSAPLQPRFGALWPLAFPKTKITFEKEEISDHRWDSGKYNRAADGNWENYVRSQGAYSWWGLRCHGPMHKVSCIFFSKCLYFSYYRAGHLLDRPHRF